MNRQPPKWADRFLQWYCRPELLEEIQGDAYELFYRKATLHPRQAKIQFVWNVLRFFKWSNIKRTKRNYSLNSPTMIKSYLTTGIRNLFRHPLNGSINILGLSLAVAIAITTFIVIDNQLHADHFHRNIDRIYQVTSYVKIDKGTEEWSDSPIMLGPSMLQEQTNIESFTRIEYGNADIRYNQNVFNEQVWFVDPSFFEIFSFPILAGDQQGLKTKNQIVLESSIAKKYFGEADPIGQSLSLKFRERDKQEFIISAVFERPTGSTLYPSIFLSMDSFQDMQPDKINDWGYKVDGTFILLRADRSIAEVKNHMRSFVRDQNAASPQWLVDEYHFRPFKGLGLVSHEIISSISQGSQMEGLVSLAVIASFLLILASLNYMNVTVATVATRLKEIGIRKVIGGQKKQIITQFLTENFLMCSLALVVGGIISYLFMLPGFNALFPSNILFEFSSGNIMFLFFAGLLFFIGLISGAYPAFYIASFQPIEILRGKEKFGQKSLFSRVLLTFQFTFAFITMVGSFVFIDNSIHLKNKDWGYQHDNLMAVRVEEKDKYLTLRNQLTSNPNVVHLAGADNHIGKSDDKITLTHHEQQIETIDFRVGYNYLEAMNIRLVEGRTFTQTIQSDEVESVVINETFGKKLGWARPIGQMIEIDSVKRYVIGVVADFHYKGFYDVLGPAMFRVAKEDDFNFLAIQVREGHMNEVQEQVKSFWQNIAPYDTYEGFVQDDVFASFNQNNNAHVQLLTFVCLITIILASLGLLGLVFFNTTRRMKEYSIRKVMGATGEQIFQLMNKDYVIILSTAFILGAPSGFFLVNSLIQKVYPDPKGANPLPFILAVSIMMAVVAITVTTQLVRITKQSPSEVLRND
ncbi:MAG: ABC transporter permease [Cyclobacteriaceae bacterium]|jgi:putative ABC transport system permease protein|nr:ABC transporter permease [Flammeovirgaceae bacterium]